MAHVATEVRRDRAQRLPRQMASLWPSDENEQADYSPHSFFSVSYMNGSYCMTSARTKG